MEEKLTHYVEKKYINGQKEIKRVPNRDPLFIDEDPSLISIRFFDTEKIYFPASEGTIRYKESKPINYSNYYFYGERRNIDYLEKQAKVMEEFYPGQDKTIENLLKYMLKLGREEVILDYRYKPLNPVEIFPAPGDTTITEYKRFIKESKKKTLKK